MQRGSYRPRSRSNWLARFNVRLRRKRTHPVKLLITHIVGGPIAPYESAVILSVTPNHGGVTDARQDQQQRERFAGGRAFCGGPSRQASGPSAATVAGADVSCAGQANPGGLRRPGGGENIEFSPAISPRLRRALRRAKVRSLSCRTRPNLSTAARSRAKSDSPKPSTPGATRPGSSTC